MLLALLIANVVLDGGGIFYFYTQWTFTLVTIYFGFGSAISIYGCRKHCGKVGGHRAYQISLDSDHGTYVPPTLGKTADVSNQSKHFDAHGAPYHPPLARAWTYAFQIIYQTCAGAVMLIDSVFWLILFPTLTSKRLWFEFCKWPYPFLDLSSSYASLWYLGVGVMHIPCYGIFALIIKLKEFSLSRSFPDSYRKLR
ncbi:hypothetical protein DITRI_Ditri17bG0065200 [Diplodiscus trichospermus]